MRESRVEGESANGADVPVGVDAEKVGWNADWPASDSAGEAGGNLHGGVEEHSACDDFQMFGQFA